ncbi:MAG: outer membrane protein assembly factor BamA [Nitrospirae bacterium]|nr:outer membrane protein assembly factor BamA [Nitrospirota bacterium]
MKYLLYILTFIILFSSVNAYSQDDLSAFAGRKIYSVKSISVSGLTDKSIEKVCDIKSGDIFSVSAIRGCIVSFFQKGIFKDIQVEAYEEMDGVMLQFTFIEKIKVAAIKVEGSDYYSAKKIKASAGVKIGDEFTEDVTASVREHLLDLYRGQGFFDADVDVKSGSLEGDGTGVGSGLFIKVNEGKRAKVSAVILNGNRVFSDNDIKDVMKIREGKYYIEKDVYAGIKALDKFYPDKGYIKIMISPPDIIYDREKREILISLYIEAGPHVEILFEGVEDVKPEVLQKELLFRKEKSVDAAVIDESIDMMTRYYRDMGYYLARITYALEKPDENNIRIKFHVTEGISVLIKEIRFTGNSYFDSKILMEFLNTKEEKFFLEDVLQEDIKDIANLYKSNGFLGVKITYDVSFIEEDMTLNLSINIEEGVQTHISGISITGNQKFSTQGLKRSIKSREGKPFNESHVVDDMYTIQSLYVQKGHLYAGVDLKTRYSEDKKGVGIDYAVSEDKPVYLGNIFITGNSFTKDYVIRRELLIKEGDLYSYENILRSQRRLLSLGYVRDVRLEPVNPDVKEHRKDIAVHIDEGFPGTVELGVGYGDVERFRGTFEARYKNLLGTGRQVSMKVEGSSIEQKYGVGYKEPWIFGYQADGRINVADQMEKKKSFNRRTFGLTTGIDKSFSDFVKGSLMFQYEDVKLSDVSPTAILTSEDTGKTEVATINPSLMIDRRDDPFNPKRGQFYSIAFREAAQLIGSTPQFVKINLQSSFFYSPFSRVVLALSARGGAAWNFGESTEVPIFERYFAGGRSTVRGYDQEKLGIPGKTIIYDGQSWNPTGGNMMVVLNGEIRFPLFKGLGMVTFVDGGNVWRKIEEFDAAEIKKTAGLGIRYDTPVGPLRLDMGCKLDKEAGEDKCVLHFTLGHAF